MISVVVTESNNVKGYIIEDIYIKREYLKYFTSDKSFKGVKVLGKSTGQNIKVGNRVYKSIMHYLNIKDYNKVIRSLVLNGVSLNKFLFIPCKVSDLDLNLLSEVWSVVKDLKYKNLFCYKVVTDKGNDVAYVLSYNDLYKGSFFHINMLEVVDKNKGTGSAIVFLLKSFNKSLSGLSFINSVEFWKKVGASFKEDFYFVI